MDLATISQIALAVFSVVGTIAGILHSINTKKAIGFDDIRKAKDAAEDVVDVVKKLRSLGKKPEEAAEIGVSMVEGLRGKQLSKKVRRKTRAHIIAQAGFADGETVEGIAQLTKHNIV